MVTPSHLKEARKRLTKLNKLLIKKLLKEDNCVLVVHTNQTVQLFRNAVAHYEEVMSHGYLFVFTKEQGNFCYSAEDLIHFSKFIWHPLEVADFLGEEPMKVLKEK